MCVEQLQKRFPRISSAMECPDTPWDKGDDFRVKKRPVEKPSCSAKFFLKFLKSKSISKGKLVDIGCGNGRNAVYFAEHGYEVHAVDRSDDVLKDLDLHGVMPHCHSVTDYWMFEDDFFDLAMDILCYSDQDDEAHRSIYLSELKRVLKPGGLFLLSVPACYQKEKLEKDFPGFEILLSEKTDDKIAGKEIKTLNIIFSLRRL